MKIYMTGTLIAICKIHFMRYKKYGVILLKSMFTKNIRFKKFTNRKNKSNGYIDKIYYDCKNKDYVIGRNRSLKKWVL